MGKQAAAAITKYNDEDPSASLEVIQKDIPANLQEGEVLVRLKLRPINPSDMFCMRGRYGGFTPQQLPAIPGLEGKVHSLLVCMPHAHTPMHQATEPWMQGSTGSNPQQDRQAGTHLWASHLKLLHMLYRTRCRSKPWPSDWSTCEEGSAGCCCALANCRRRRHLPTICCSTRKRPGKAPITGLLRLQSERSITAYRHSTWCMPSASA